MYKILLDNTLMFDSRIEELALVNPVVELEENKAGSLSFTITPDHPRYEDISRRKSLIQVYQDDVSDDNLLFSGIVIEVDVDFYKQKSVYCEGEMTYFNDSIQRPAKYQGITVRGLLEAYINNHNAQVETEKQFTVGMVTVTDSNNSLYCFSNMESTMECLKEDLVDDLGGYMRIRHQNGVKYIDYLKDSMVTNEQVIRLGENLMDFTSNIDSSEIATAIIPLGAKLETSPIEGLETRLDIKSVNGGLDYVHDADAVANFGWIYKTVEWDNVTVASNLKTKGEKYLSEIQFENMVIEAKAIDLHFTDKGIERFKLSDQIRVVSRPHGLNKYFRLTKQTINLTNPENDAITLGKDEKLTISAKTNQVNEAIYKAMESITPASTILKQAKDNATALINGNGENGHVVLHENADGVVYEILVMDTADINTATKVWRWNQNGLGYADDKDSQGNWKFGLAMTMDGAIVADYITSGKLTGLEIDNGSGTFHVDPNGTMTAVNADISGKVTSTSGSIGGFTIESDRLKNGDAIFNKNRIACGKAGHGMINLLGSQQGTSSNMGCIQISNSGSWEDCLDGIRIYGDGKIKKYDSDGNVEWTRYLHDI